MNNKRRTDILIFTLAVMALLLRPYFAYQLAENQQLTKDPVALNSLLQRLIKKKDDHHASNAAELSAIQCAQTKIQPRLPQMSVTPKPVTGFAALTVSRCRSARFHSSTAYYKLFSTFRI